MNVDCPLLILLPFSFLYSLPPSPFFSSLYFISLLPPYPLLSSVSSLFSSLSFFPLPPTPLLSISPLFSSPGWTDSDETSVTENKTFYRARTHDSTSLDWDEILNNEPGKRNK